MCSSDLLPDDDGTGVSELRQFAKWKGSNSEGREALLDRIQSIMPQCAML